MRILDNKGRRLASYNVFTLHVRVNGKRKSFKVYVHRLLAYQKFGDALFTDGIEVRHLDDDSRNNRWDNIGLGTHRQNMLDQSLEKRRAIAAQGCDVRAAAAAAANRLFTDDVEELIFQRYGDGSTYIELASEFDASSATIYRILSRVRARLVHS